jgi:triacylglycerol lipase
MDRRLGSEVNDVVCDRSAGHVGGSGGRCGGHRLVAQRGQRGGRGLDHPSDRAAAGDEVSAAIASLFSSRGTAFQALSAQAAAFHAQFVQALNAAGSAYTDAEAASASSLRTLGQDVLGAINAPFLAATGRSLIGNGTSGAMGLTQAANKLATNIFGSPPTLIPATQGAIFTGTPSLATKYEIGSLFALKGLAGYLPPNLTTQLSRVTGALFSLEFSNTPPKFLPLLLEETVQHTTFDGMPVLQITPAHPSGHYWSPCPAAIIPFRRHSSTGSITH